MKARSVFQYQSYKEIMKYSFRRKGTRGNLSRAAEALNCQRSYLSRVMNSKLHLTFDQAFLLCRHWKLSIQEQEYFMTLLELDRAGNPTYKESLLEKTKDLRRTHESLSSRIQRPLPQTMGGQQIQYFSAWHWCAIHFLTSSPKFQTVEALAERLGLHKEMIFHHLKLLNEMGLVARNGNKWEYAKGEFHMPNDSPLVHLHHQNWRSRALLDAQNPQSEGIHFTNVQTMKRTHFLEIKEQLLKFISYCKSTFDPSPAEDAVAMTCDFFSI